MLHGKEIEGFSLVSFSTLAYSSDVNYVTCSESLASLPSCIIDYTITYYFTCNTWMKQKKLYDMKWNESGTNFNILVLPI